MRARLILVGISVGILFGTLGLLLDRTLPDEPWRWPLIAFGALAFGMALLSFAIARAMARPIALREAPNEVPSPAHASAIEEAEAHGFHPSGPPLVPAGSEGPVLLLFDDGASFAMLGDAPHTVFLTTFDLPGRPGLATTNAPAAGALGAEPMDLMQIFPGASFEELLTQHRRALEMTRARGVPILAPEQHQFEPLLRLSLAQARRRFLRALPVSLLRYLWQSNAKRTPYFGPLRDQALARETLSRLARLADGSGGYEGPPEPF